MKSLLNKLLYLILFGFIFRSNFTYAQDSTPLQWITITKEDGLADNKVYSILEDRQRNLWFGTNVGVSCYDGKIFTNFTKTDGLAGDTVLAIMQDRQGNLWFGTYRNGVSRYDGKTFTTFTTAHGLAGNDVRTMLEDRQGNLWFGTNYGASRYDGKTFTVFTEEDGLAGNDVQAMVEDRQGNLWFGMWRNGVSCYNGKTFTSFTNADGLVGNYIQTIVADRQGKLWFGTYRIGVSRYDGKTFTTFTKADGLAGDNVRAMVEDRFGNLWFGTTDGVSRYDGKIFNSLTIADGLAGNKVNFILEDCQGYLWLGTDNGINTNSLNNFTKAQGLAGNRVSSILEDRQGNIWVGTGEGVSRYNGQSFVNFTTADGLVDNNVYSILEDRKSILWITTYKEGISKYDGIIFTNFSLSGLRRNFVQCILEDHYGNLWFGMGNFNSIRVSEDVIDILNMGVFKYDGKTFIKFTKSDGLAERYVNSILEDRQGDLWFGTNEGVSRYDGNSFINFTTAQGLVNACVFSILEDCQGILWFGTNNGVSRYDSKSFTNFTTVDGLAGNVVRVILEDRQSNLWFGTNKGVSRYDGNSFTNFDTAQGLAGNIVRSIVQDRQSNLWFGTDNGVSRCRFTKKTPAIGCIKEISVGLFFIVVQFNGFSYNTSANELKFTSRFDNESWSKPQKRKWLLKSYLLGTGEHTFRIRAYDQFKNFPPTIEKKFTITKLQWLENIFLYCLILLSFVFFAAIKVRKTVKRRDALKRKLNPYIAGPPITDSKMFYGREELIHAIINAVPKNNIAIRAERRIGKTSILHQLEKRLTKPFLPVLINIQGIKEQDFFSRLTEKIIRMCKKYFKANIDLILGKNSSQYDDIDFMSDLDTITCHLKDTLKQEVIVVLLLDEIDELVGYDIQISKRFRAIFTEGKLPVRTVVAGTFFDQQKWDDKTSPWFNFFVIHRLESLTEPEARALITKPSKGIYLFDKDAIEQILTLSGKQPYLIQTICHYAINKILAEKRRKVTAADIEAVYHSSIEGKEKP